MEDKLEVGMYVRIKWGNGLQTISQCKNIVNMGDTQYAKEDFYIHTDHSGEVIYKTMIVKSSFDIIDILEVGDYVNGKKIVDVGCLINGPRKGTKVIDYYITPSAVSYLENEDIKSVITHEQIEQMAYKMGE